MAGTVVLRIRQKGYVRSAGFQATQWAVTVPVSDPMSAPLIGTAPIAFAPIFLVRNVEGFESLDGIATTLDLVRYPQSELAFFEVRGTNGNVLLESGQPNDLLVFPDAVPLGPLSYWLEDSAPYNTNSFIVKNKLNRAQGNNSKLFVGNKLQLPGYTFTNADIGRWVQLSGFADPLYNTYMQITALDGGMAVVATTITANVTGGTWQFPYILIETNVDPTKEPRFFPTKETNLSWQVWRGSNLITSNTSGGATLRGNEASVVRSLRYTSVLPTQAAANNLFAACRKGAELLQKQAETADTAFTSLLTSTYGP